ncbi:hypothetical protein A2Y85_07825 [candidate division WOR-3 bacterium RBG_13_43_14]|uniref:Uncharacterized protein n=1 Tax=candidate division WOR-3 bacterium RBG_13_43_14 TaxID=1802590 RepID=A0A1F4UEV7_UNCW3|nr:MAG: hypothetical protein A2Y85_07825 [candidate division WOR-3 bacterium RBG_13_43_14]
MKRSIILIWLFVLPCFLSAINPIHTDLVSGHAGYPFNYGMAVLGIRAFPFSKSPLFLSRLGFEYYIEYGSAVYYEKNATKYHNIDFFPYRVMVLLFPSSVLKVGSKHPFYSFIYAGGEIFAWGHKENDQVYRWGGGDVRSMYGGVCLSFRGVLEMNVVYNKIRIEDHLGVNQYGDFIEYVPDRKSSNVGFFLQLNIGTALLEWIKPSRK